MDAKTYRRCVAAIGAICGGAMGIFLVLGNLYYALAAFATALFAEMLCRKRLEEAVEDERIWRIRERAAWRTLQVFLVAGALAAVASVAGLLAEPWRSLGVALGFIVCALLAAYTLLYAYYSWVM